jgi:hypothetical protein
LLQRKRQRALRLQLPQSVSHPRRELLGEVSSEERACLCLRTSCSQRQGPDGNPLRTALETSLRKGLHSACSLRQGGLLLKY